MKQLTKDSSQEELREYFTKVLELSKSQDEFPVDLDEVWKLSYKHKRDALAALRESDLFFEGEDFVDSSNKWED